MTHTDDLLDIVIDVRELSLKPKPVYKRKPWTIDQTYEGIKKVRESYKDDGGTIEGYRLHENPDGSVVFLEGRAPHDSHCAFSAAELISLKACAKRRGLTLPFNQYKNLSPENRVILRSIRIQSQEDLLLEEFYTTIEQDAIADYLKNHPKILQ